MAKPSLMNLHILILILLNGHKISCPQQQLDTEALSQSETFCEEYSVFKTVAFESAVSSKTSIEQLRFFSVSFRKWKKSVKTWEIYMHIIFLYQIFQKTVSWQFILETFPCKGFITRFLEIFQT